MAGRVLKITIENTHPPIWRRVIIPERITFRDLHEIIQILFGWEGYHLHCFENFTRGFRVDCMEDSMAEILEDQVMVDDYIEQLPWIRYIYDFGDDWKHKIVFEKIDPSYNLRYASLVKYKGDNLMEDCGGIGGWMQFLKFDPSEVTMQLKALEIPEREIEPMMAPSEPSFASELERLLDQCRKDNPLLADFSNTELMDLIANTFMGMAEEVGQNENVFRCSDEELQKQINLLEDNKAITVVQSKKTLQKNLLTMEERTIKDYLKYSRLTCDQKNSPSTVFADYLSKNVDILYYFFLRDELEDLLVLWDSYRAGQTTLNNQYLLALGKCIIIGLAKLTGKRKLKLNLCAEFGQIIEMIDRENLDKVYSLVNSTVETTGALLMAYVAMPFDQFYQIYSKHAKIKMDRKDYECLLYWNGTMNGEIDTASNSMTGENYLMIPGMKIYLEKLEENLNRKGFQIEPRDISEIEFGRWVKGLNAAIPEWDRYLEEQEDDFTEEDIFDNYRLISSGRSMTDMILDELDDVELFEIDKLDPTDLLCLESDLWHDYADLCLATPIMGLNGYSRRQYAEKFQQPLDYIPLFNENILTRRITKNTHIYEFPKDIQLEMLEAKIKGADEYEKVITRLSRKYKSNQALEMELTTITSDKLYEEHPDFAEKINEQSNIYPWSKDEYILPKAETYIRETKKVGRNDPCPCGSGRKYKHCCGK